MTWFRRHSPDPDHDPAIKDHLARSAAWLHTQLAQTGDQQDETLTEIKRRASGTARRKTRPRPRRRDLDALTGLPRRAWLMKRTETLLHDAERAGVRAALILIDFNRFRAVNHTLGHQAGDHLLRQIADRLRHALPRDAEAAHMGADEFAVILPAATSAESVAAVTESLLDTLQSPFCLAELTLVLEASTGVVLFPDHALDAEQMLRCADVAMYRAKRDLAGVQVYDPAWNAPASSRLALTADLLHALDANQVELHYQPKVRFDGEVIALEALPRWVHPQRGNVPPDEFLALAESSGLMRRLTQYLLAAAVTQVARWRALGLRATVSVNVSPHDIHTQGFADSLLGLLARHHLPGQALQLEVTEEVLNQDPLRAAESLDHLVRHGVRMSLDAFGTGYSSLVRLRRLRLSELKIDRSLVARMAIEPEDAEIVRCSVDLAHSLGLLVVAEGVEDDDTWDRLRDMGCDAVQGWLVAAAMPAEEATAWLVTHERGPATISRPTRDSGR